MSSLWLSGAKVITARSSGTLQGGNRYCTWHTTENDPSTTTATNLANYLNRVNSAGHFVVHPLSGEIVQMMPANRAARYLRNLPGGVQTNNSGSVHIQIEVVAQARKPFTGYWTVAGRDAIQRIAAFARSHGVPDTWPAGRPAATYSGPHNKIGPGPSGHYGHSQWKENDHWDPGAVDISAILALTTPPKEATVLTRLLVSGARAGEARSRDSNSGGEVSLLQKMLNTLHGAKLDADGSFGPATETAVKAAQKARRLDVDGRVGQDTRAALNAAWAEHNNPKPTPAPPTEAKSISPEDWRLITTGPAYAFYKDMLADDPETAPRVSLGRAIESATEAALAVLAELKKKE